MDCCLSSSSIAGIAVSVIVAVLLITVIISVSIGVCVSQRFLLHCIIHEHTCFISSTSTIRGGRLLLMTAGLLITMTSKEVCYCHQYLTCSHAYEIIVMMDDASGALFLKILATRVN